MSIGLPEEQPPADDELSEWLSRLILDLNGIIQTINRKEYVEIDVVSTVAQAPVVLDAPVKIAYDTTQAGAYDGVRVTAAGDITFDIDDVYYVELQLTVGRTTTSAASYHTTYPVVDGSSSGGSVTTGVSDTNDIVAVTYKETAKFTKGQVLSFWQVVDSAGNINAGLVPFVTTNVTIPDTPSARLVIKRNLFVD